MDLNRHLTKEDIQINGQSARKMMLSVFIRHQGKANQSHRVPTSHPRWQVLAKLCRRVSHLTLQVGLSRGAAALEKNLAIVEKLKIALL